MTREFKVVMVTVFLLVFSSARGAVANQLVGNGEWRSLAGEDLIRGTWSFTLQQDDRRIQGTMRVSGSNLFSSATVEGTLDRENIVLGLASDGNVVATFSGKVDGQSIAGEWSCPRVKDEGVWYGTVSTGDGNSALR